MTLGSEALGKSVHNDACATISASHDESCEDSAEHHETTEHTDCTDSCHTGPCHFGHCLVVISNAFVSYATIENLENIHAFSKSLVEGPYLEGPLQPPKQASIF